MSFRSVGSKFMSIPVDAPFFTVPVFAVPALRYYVQSIVNDALSDIVVNLFPGTLHNRYRSASAAVRFALGSSFHTYRLVPVRIPDRNCNYWGTCGAVFDSDFNPVFVCAWQFRRQGLLIVPVRPVLYVRPDVYTGRADPIQSFAATTLVRTALSLRRLYFVSHSQYVASTDEDYHVQVIIDWWPYPVHHTAEPSILTTDAELRELALRHSDEWE